MTFLCWTKPRLNHRNIQRGVARISEPKEARGTSEVVKPWLSIDRGCADHSLPPTNAFPEPAYTYPTPGFPTPCVHISILDLPSLVPSLPTINRAYRFKLFSPGKHPLAALRP